MRPRRSAAPTKMGKKQLKKRGKSVRQSKRREGRALDVLQDSNTRRAMPTRRTRGQVKQAEALKKLERCRRGESVIDVVSMISDSLDTSGAERENTGNTATDETDVSDGSHKGICGTGFDTSGTKSAMETPTKERLAEEQDSGESSPKRGYAQQEPAGPQMRPKRLKRRRIMFARGKESKKLEGLFDDGDSVPDVQPEPYQSHEEKDKENGSEKTPLPSIAPIQVDPNLSFADVGGLDSVKDELTEMVFFPLVYPELIKEIGTTPPRGAIFYGPPGTGKTLLARALASSASRAGRRVSFFMRKGADILSKWVGESEKELRLLFEEAKRQQPAIIFFDEIDGLAPVRNAKSDQCYSSIVTTLLALMDGLEDRGQVVVIGATNNLDALDPALRRPGRFDREFKFPLPDVEGRLKILNIHADKLRYPPSPALRRELAEQCVGFVGADLKALCTEATLNGLRRSLPQIYKSDKKLLVDADMVSVEKRDFMEALRTIMPSTERSTCQASRALSELEDCLLHKKLANAFEMVCNVFPVAKLFEGNKGADGSLPQSQVRSMMADQIQIPWVLLCGKKDCGVKLLARALLHKMDSIPVHCIGLHDIYAEDGSRVEEAFIRRFNSALRSAPSVLYLPDIETFWSLGGPLLKSFIKTRLEDMLSTPVLLLITSGAAKKRLNKKIMRILGAHTKENILELKPPKKGCRRDLFACAITRGACSPSSEVTPQAPPTSLKELPLDPVAEEEEESRAAKLTEQECRNQFHDDQRAILKLRIALRQVVCQVINDSRWADYREPVPMENVDFYELVLDPMDLGTILSRVNGQQYQTVAAFLTDVEKIAKSIEAFYEDNPTAGQEDCTCARALVDEIFTLVGDAVEPSLAQKCEDIRKRGGPIAPEGMMLHDEAVEVDELGGITARNQSKAAGQRVSARLQGAPAPPMLSTPEVKKKKARVQREGTEDNGDEECNEGPEEQEGNKEANPGGGVNNAGGSLSTPCVVSNKKRASPDQLAAVLGKLVERTKGWTTKKLLESAVELSMLRPTSLSDLRRYLKQMAPDDGCSPTVKQLPHASTPHNSGLASRGSENGVEGVGKGSSQWRRNGQCGQGKGGQGEVTQEGGKTQSDQFQKRITRSAQAPLKRTRSAKGFPKQARKAARI